MQMADNKKFNGGGRNYSLDLLRIIAMLMVLTLHINQGSGYLPNTDLSSFIFAVKAYEHISIVAVDLFIIISSWFLCQKSTLSYSRLISLLITVIFWTIVMDVIALIAGAKVSLGYFSLDIPIIGKSYDFISGYILLCIVSPFLNKAVESISHITHRNLAIGLFILFSVLAPITTSQYINIRSGYHIVWFIVLYIITSYFRTVSVHKYKMLYLIGYPILLCLGIFGDYWGLPVVGSLDYNNFIVALSAFCVFFIFENIDIRNIYIERLIGVLAPCVLGVYLIHANPLFYRYVRPLDFSVFFNNDVRIYLISVPLIVFTLFLLFSIAEFLRIKLFSFIKVPDLVNHISSIVSNKTKEQNQY